LNLLHDEPQRFCEKLGATKSGVTLFELARVLVESKYLWEGCEEEWLVVIAGRPTLRTPEGERVLEPWDTAVFVRGEAGAHQVRNDTDDPVRVVMFSTVSDPEVVVYPDEDKIGVHAQWSRDDRPTIKGWVEPR
jgi:uncharacterized cupin superfamily protein